MTQPPEYVEHRTETQQLEDAIIRACRGIREHWGDMLPAEPSGFRAGGGSRSAGILSARPEPDGYRANGHPYWLADNSPSGADVDAATRLASLRQWVTEMLNSWSRLVWEERPVKASKALPNGSDVIDMCRFLERQAQWLSGHMAAPDARDELEDIAAKVLAVADPFRREWLRLGDCPFILLDHEGQGAFCTGIVRERIGSDEDEAACTVCKQVGPREWWEDVMGKVVKDIVRAPEMARILSDRLKVNVTERTVRNWARDGRIAPFTPFGPQPDPKHPRWFFDVRTVVAQVALMDRDCPMCGRLWSGEGSVCARCWNALRDANSQKAEPRPAYPIVAHAPKPETIPAAFSEDERLDVDPITGRGKAAPRCAYSDMPIRWCGCGRRHKVA